MKEWWQGLNTREQQLVAAMSVVVVIFLFITLVWQPLNTNIEKAKAKVEKQQELAIWVQENSAKLKQLQKSGGSAKARGSLSSIVDRSAKSRGIAIARMQPQGDDLQVWVDEVAFKDLLSWLEHLTNQQGLVISTADIALGNQPGTVKVRRLQFSKV